MSALNVQTESAEISFTVKRSCIKKVDPTVYFGYNRSENLISLADVLHSENPEKLEDEWIEEYELQQGDFDVLMVDTDLVQHIPTATQMGKVYKRLIFDTMQPTENYVDGMIRVYNDDLCEILDNYNCGAFYEPSYCITRAYNDGGF